MTKAKAVRILQAIISMKVGAKSNVDRFRWNAAMKDAAREMLQEDIDALRLAIEGLKR